MKKIYWIVAIIGLALGILIGIVYSVGKISSASNETGLTPEFIGSNRTIDLLKYITNSKTTEEKPKVVEKTTFIIVTQPIIQPTNQPKPMEETTSEEVIVQPKADPIPESQPIPQSQPNKGTRTASA